MKKLHIADLESNVDFAASCGNNAIGGSAVLVIVVIAWQVLK